MLPLREPCDPPVVNPVACENTRPGTDPGRWSFAGAGDPTIQGFATDVSVQRGTTVHFKIKTSSTDYHLDIYRVGYYQGLGRARSRATSRRRLRCRRPSRRVCFDPASAMTDCGNWRESASWAVPSTAVSGIYFAMLTRDDLLFNAFSHIFFVVRDDSSHADVLYQTSDTTYNAYNRYGGNSLYSCTIGCPPGADPPRGYKVSFNRPNTAADIELADSFFHSEFQMVKWLEQNGYDVAYQSSVDTDRLGASVLQQHKVFVSSGHDEYWSGAQRTNVEAARDAGVNLAFFSGNEVFWKIRYENSTDGSSTAYRTQVSYKETHSATRLDPRDPSIWTGTWRDARFSPPADGGRPENSAHRHALQRQRRRTGLPHRSAGGRREDALLAQHHRGDPVGRADRDACAQHHRVRVGRRRRQRRATCRPVPSARRPHTPWAPRSVETREPSNSQGRSPITSRCTVPRAARWCSAPAPSNGPGGCRERPTARAADTRMQQATVNLLADMGVQPATLQSGITAATMSTDTTAPTTTISSPTAGTSSPVGSTVTVSGTARDTGGRVGGRRGEHRQRRDLAPGAGPRELDVPVACRSNGLDDSRGAGGRRQRQPANDRRGRHRARRMSVHTLRQRGDSWPAQGSSVARGAVRRRTSSATA